MIPEQYINNEKVNEKFCKECPCYNRECNEEDRMLGCPLMEILSPPISDEELERWAEEYQMKKIIEAGGTPY